MGIGNITDVERVKRLAIIDKLTSEGKTDHEISQETGWSIMSIKRGKTYLEDLQKADLTSVEVGQKRAELYIKLSEAEAEAKALFFEYKEPLICPKCNGTGREKENEDGSVFLCVDCKGFGSSARPLDTNRFHKEWLETIDRMMKLYGLDNVKSEKLTINQQYNIGMEQEKFPAETVDKIAKIVIEGHEKK